jgi:hypothetical protein
VVYKISTISQRGENLAAQSQLQVARSKLRIYLGRHSVPKGASGTEGVGYFLHLYLPRMKQNPRAPVGIRAPLKKVQHLKHSSSTDTYRPRYGVCSNGLARCCKRCEIASHGHNERLVRSVEYPRPVEKCIQVRAVIGTQGWIIPTEGTSSNLYRHQVDWTHWY